MRYLLMCFGQKRSRKERIVEKGSAKIEKMLDLKSIIKHQWAL